MFQWDASETVTLPDRRRIWKMLFTPWVGQVLLKIDVYLSFAISSCLPVASSGLVSSGTGGTFGRWASLAPAIALDDRVTDKPDYFSIPVCNHLGIMLFYLIRNLTQRSSYWLWIYHIKENCYPLFYRETEPFILGHDTHFEQIPYIKSTITYRDC